jgi:hypothetical protein
MTRVLPHQPKTRSSVLVIAVHFGVFPAWMNLTLETFSQNQTIDLLLVTDQPTHKLKNSPNLRYRQQTLAEFSRTLSTQLDLSIDVKRGYKMCDFRPAFGQIFASELDGYDYWGHIDLDTFWGDIDRALADPIAAHYDIICGEPNHVGGPFCLYRNTPAINRLYQSNPVYQTAFQREDNVDFDEIGIHINHQGFETTVRHLEQQAQIRVYRDRQFYLQDSDSAWWISQVKNAYPGYDPVPDIPPFEFGTGYWQNGRLITAAQQEFMFYHFYDGKRRLFQPIPLWGSDRLTSFTVGKSGIHRIYSSPIDRLYHRLETLITTALHWAIYDLGPLRKRLGLSKQ